MLLSPTRVLYVPQPMNNIPDWIGVKEENTNCIKRKHFLSLRKQPYQSAGNSARNTTPSKRPGGPRDSRIAAEESDPPQGGLRAWDNRQRRICRKHKDGRRCPLNYVIEDACFHVCRAIAETSVSSGPIGSACNLYARKPVPRMIVAIIMAIQVSVVAALSDQAS